jgi:hyperosmotically inducible protein
VITKQVTDQLIEDLSIKNQSVNVQTVQGVVTLTGAVETPRLRERAGRIAADVRGVRSVNNQITLMENAPPIPPSNQP